MTEQLLEVGHVAQMAGCSLSLVRWYADQGRLPMAAITPRGTRLFRRADVEAFLHHRRRTVSRVT